MRTRTLPRPRVVLRRVSATFSTRARICGAEARSARTKRIPRSAPAGRIRMRTLSPLCSPMPEHSMAVAMVRWYFKGSPPPGSWLVSARHPP